jgi:hypothetical protein
MPLWRALQWVRPVSRIILVLNLNGTTTSQAAANIPQQSVADQQVSSHPGCYSELALVNHSTQIRALRRSGGIKMLQNNGVTPHKETTWDMKNWL